MYRAERRHRLLEDVGDLAAPDVAHLLAVGIERSEVDHLFPVVTRTVPEQDLSANDLAGFVQNAENRPGRYALAAAALPNDAKRLARVQVEAGAVHGYHRSFVEREVGSEVPNGEQWFSCPFSLGYRTSRRGPLHL